MFLPEWLAVGVCMWREEMPNLYNKPRDPNTHQLKLISGKVVRTARRGQMFASGREVVIERGFYADVN